MYFPHPNGRVVYGTPKVMGLQLAVTEDVEFVELTLLKGGNIPPHALDLPVTFYVVTGEGVVSVDGVEFPLKSGDIATSVAGSTRELTNTGDADLKVLVIKGC